jgi:opacity protein-like surface antigen
VAALAALVLSLPAVATAQTRRSQPSAAPAEVEKGYVEVDAQSAFGNVTSQSFGGEVGVTVWENVQIYAEGGVTRDVAPASLGAAAQLIAGALSQTQTNVGVSIKEPATFFVGGARYLIPVTGTRLQPYVLGGIGVAKLSRDVKFTVNGTDVTSNLAQLGVQLGTDLSGDSTKLMFTLGGGIAYPVWQRLVVDVQFRYGRILADDAGINLGRVGLGVGVRF